jgi:hypothetical protein
MSPVETLKQAIGVQQTSPAKQVLDELTSMPGACQTTLRSEHTHFKRSSIMRAIGIHGMDPVRQFDQQNFAALDTLNLCFDLFSILQI